MERGGKIKSGLSVFLFKKPGVCETSPINGFINCFRVDFLDSILKSRMYAICL